MDKYTVFEYIQNKRMKMMERRNNAVKDGSCSGLKENEYKKVTILGKKTFKKRYTYNRYWNYYRVPINN